MSSLGALAGQRIIPVIVIRDAARAVDLAHALRDGGIPCAEVTLRTPAALDAIRAMSAVEGFTVGVGTALTVDHVVRATEAGARFVVSPGFDAALVDAARDRGAGVLPGIATATEAMWAIRAGLDAVKFFPADRLGGLGTIRALAAALPTLGFVPSGGVDAALAATYLGDPAVPAVSGSWMAPAALIDAGDFAEIARRSADAVREIGEP
jgi:2-dehydro-3-deoxyphosphogluconate aldolase/(4S)-4-hydroxy-2-oxoglutarate aldolase